MDVPVLDTNLDRERFAKESVELFKRFSRFEYALKWGGFLKKGMGKHKPADPDWKTFASALGSDFYDRVKGNAEMRILIDKPPSQLRFKPGVSPDPAEPEWVPRTYTPYVQGLIESVKQVRNNLFHGDKTSPDDVGRNSKLIGAACKVLKEVLVWIKEDEPRKDKFVSFVDRMTMPLMV